MSALAADVFARYGLPLGSIHAPRIEHNYLNIDGANNCWKEVDSVFENLRKNQDRTTEREAARFLQRPRFQGLGPKQSRNVLQMLGLTRYEIPIDTRIVKRFESFGLPIGLKLSTERDYCRVLDDIQELCEACGILPCVLDAAIFLRTTQMDARSGQVCWPVSLVEEGVVDARPLLIRSPSDSTVSP